MKSSLIRTGLVNQVSINTELSIPNINWGRGRLLPYESNVSFLAKFCFLNGISPVTAKRFLEKKCNCVWTPDGFPQSGILPLSNLLEENVKTVNKFYRHELDLVLCFDNRTDNTALDFHITQNTNRYRFSFCPACLEMGYHASFHEFEWLSKCPIHHLELTVHQSLYYRNSDTFYKYIQIFTEALNTKCPKWMSIQSKGTINKLMLDVNFQDFRNWVRAAQQKAIFINDGVQIAISGTNYTLENLDQFWKRLNWAVPIPKEIKAILEKKVYFTEPLEYRKLNSIEVDQLRKIISLTPLRQLKSFYAKQVMLEEKFPMYRKKAMEMLIKLQLSHLKCNCKWAIDNRGQWWEVGLNRGYLTWGICPVQVAIQNLQNEWCDFRNGDSKKNSYGIWSKYVYEAQEFNELGLGHLVYDKGNEKFFQPIIQLTIPQNVISLIDEVLHIDFLDYKDHLLYWFEKIEKGSAPDSIKDFVVRSMLIRVAEDCFLLRWPRE